MVIHSAVNNKIKLSTSIYPIHKCSMYLLSRVIWKGLYQYFVCFFSVWHPYMLFPSLKEKSFCIILVSVLFFFWMVEYFMQIAMRLVHCWRSAFCIIISIIYELIIILFHLQMRLPILYFTYSFATRTISVSIIQHSSAYHSI